MRKLIIVVAQAAASQVAKQLEAEFRKVATESETVLAFSHDELARADLSGIGEPALVVWEPEAASFAAARDGLPRRLLAVKWIGDDVPFAELTDSFDDFLRDVRDVAERIRMYRRCLSQMETLAEVDAFGFELEKSVENLVEDVRLARSLVAGSAPTRFEGLKGARVWSRYLAGLRSGGNHFDVLESRNGEQFSIWLSDASSYGLSSSVLSLVSRVALELSRDATDLDPGKWLQSIRTELASLLPEGHELSVFFGTYRKAAGRLDYVACGEMGAWVEGLVAGAPRFLSESSGPLNRARVSSAVAGDLFQTRSVEIPKGGRLVLLSRGFSSVLSPEQGDLEGAFFASPDEALVELASRAVGLRSPLDDEQEEAQRFPERDCSGLIIEFEPADAGQLLNLKRVR